jgi:hypothetical protein
MGASNCAPQAGGHWSRAHVRWVRGCFTGVFYSVPLADSPRGQAYALLSSPFLFTEVTSHECGRSFVQRVRECARVETVASHGGLYKLGPGINCGFRDGVTPPPPLKVPW